MRVRSAFLRTCLFALGLLYFCSSNLRAASQDHEHSSLERLMEASRPSLPQHMTLPLGEGFPKEVLVTAASDFENENLIEDETDNSPMQNESSIAANPLDPRYLIASAVDYRDGQSAWVYVSSDGGHSWKNINLGKPAGLNFVVGNDPSVAWDFAGRAYLVYGGFDAKRASGENAVFIAVSTDNGQTWNKHHPVILHQGTMTNDSAFEDKYCISIDNAAASPYHGRLYIPWKRVIDKDSSTQIVVTSSDDHGQTWSTPMRISEVLTGKSLDTTFGQSFPIAATGPNGQVYVAWNYGPLHNIGFNQSNDGGKTWGIPRLIRDYRWLGVTKNMGSQYNHTLKGGTRVESYPSLVVDTTNSSRRGWLYLTWAADPSPNIYFSRSTDEGATWSTPVIVHSDTTNDQYWQWMALDGTNGDLAVMYLDSRDDAANKLSRCYVSISRDGGSTWTDRAVDDVAFDIRRNPFAGGSLSGVFAGDYSGCAFINGKVYPSHVDMRNTYPNAADDDVYTAVVNINAPMPVSNLRATTLPLEPHTIELSWTPPTKRVFGEALAPSAFTQRFYKDSVLVQTLAGSVNSYRDTTLQPYTAHEYTIVVVADPNADSSVPRSVIGYAGGAKQPMVPLLLSVLNDTTQAMLRVHIPNMRADSVNPLVNLSKLRVYRDSVQVAEYDLQTSDTAKVVDELSPISELGYYRYAVSVLDALGNESERSPDVERFIGPVGTEWKDSFERFVMYKYRNRGTWAQTSEFSYSAPQSLTESPHQNYPSLARDTLTLFPLAGNDNRDYIVSFRHAAIVDKTDTAFVESVIMDQNDNDSVVSILGAFNRTDFDAWADNSLNAADWKAEALQYHCPSGARVALRLRFKSNIGTNADGWYIDDLGIQSVAVEVKDDELPTTLVYPNPCSQSVLLRSDAPCALRVVDILGHTMYQQTLHSADVQSITCGDWPSGVYQLEFQFSKSFVRHQLVVVH